MRVASLPARIAAAAIGVCLCVPLLVALVGCGEHTGRAVAVEPDPVGGPALLRRLTESQYRATVAQIFGPEVPIVARFEPGLRTDGLLAVGTSEAGLSAFSIEQYDAAANGVADAVLGGEWSKDFPACASRSGDAYDAACASAFVTKYGLELFRRPLTDQQLQRYQQAAKEGTAKLGSLEEGLKYALVGMMTAPQFLLRIERSEDDPDHPGRRRLDDYSSAARLSYFLTNSTPDAELLRAAGAGELRTSGGLVRQVDRLLASPGYEQAVRAFFRDMLEFDLFNDLAKDGEIYPAFNSEVAEDAQEETLRDIVKLLVTEDGDYRDLFTLRESYMTRALGVIYRQPVSSRDGWELAPLSSDGDRIGIQGQISFLALHAHPGRSSPTLRGKAMRNVFLCQDVPDPPANVTFGIEQDPTKNGGLLTARDRLVAHNTEPACAGCHKIMDPPGLGLENYDGLGTYRSLENGAPIDSSGNLDGVAYSDAAGLAQALHDHPEVPNCLVSRVYSFAVGRDIVWKERSYLDYLIADFEANGYRLPELMRTIALSDNFFAIESPADDPENISQLALAGAQGGS